MFYRVQISIMRKRIIICWLLFLLAYSAANAQYEKEEFQQLRWQEKVFYGGSFGLMFGTVTDIEVSPTVGYRLTRNLSVAVGPKYRYYRDSRVYSSTSQPQTSYTIEGHIYGGRSYLQFYILNNINDFIPIGLNAGIFLHTEYEILSLENDDFRPLSEGSGRYAIHSVFIGGGLRLPLGEKAAVNLMILWNVNESFDSPYTSPIIRFGFTF
jgi:hypothetical protein